jgi:hypothetical protein
MLFESVVRLKRDLVLTVCLLMVLLQSSCDSAGTDAVGVVHRNDTLKVAANRTFNTVSGDNMTFHFAETFYELALHLQNVKDPNHTYTGTNAMHHTLPRIHLIRIPKAGSSSLSAVARRAVGCGPPGPCCRYPGVPAGSCPNRDLYKCQEYKKVVGCTDHFSFLWYLMDNKLTSISMIRNPFSRSISGFFYPGVHHNSDCTLDMDTCFRLYMNSTKWSNVAVKMLTGVHAYHPGTTCATRDKCRNSLQAAVENFGRLTFMGVAEMWELSLLVLHLKLPQLSPSLTEFKMGVDQNEWAAGNLLTPAFLVTYIFFYVLCCITQETA